MKKSKTSQAKSENGAGKQNGAKDFLVAGIGASAGGIQALKEFFENVPADSGVAYVVILHLSPDHESRLAEVLQTTAQIPVTQVKELVKVEPNHVYVVPPSQHLGMEDGHINVEPNLTVEARRAPVDIFFRTLAESRHAGAIAVVLSGTGADGSMGLKRVKERGGAVFVQNPREAEFSEMPRNSIATDLVDAVLKVSEIPAKIIAYKTNLGAVEIQDTPEFRPDGDQAALREVFAMLRVRTGHDFTNYKHATMLRRIERRINVRELQTLGEYAAYLRENADEAKALLKDLLISVTNFFRDKQAFEYLETEVVPRILQDKSTKDEIRIWVAGCATGEEAYGLAMLFSEQFEASPNAPSVQIFATDIDEAAIAHSREGFYTLFDVADVSAERLQRFFVKDGSGFRVRRDLREMILFAKHNLLKDAPFSRLDLVTCRNLLIYFNATAQERAMETFHFALNPGAFMFLGSSESVDGAGDLYVPVNKEFRIYQSRQAEARIAYAVPDAPDAVRYNEPKKLPESVRSGAAGTSAQSENRLLERISFGDLHRQLLEQYAPPSIVVNENYDIVHLSERAGRFLQIAGGEPSKNLLHLVRPELRLELRNALFQAVQRRANVVAANLKVQTNGHAETVNIQVRPVLRQEDTARGFLLVLFEPSQNADEDAAIEKIIVSDEPIVRRLEEELERTKTLLRVSVEQYETQTEELKASNEELQAINEELRSTAEELETSREELQSVNEELMTVNDELKFKIEELSQSNSDFKNLLNSTDIGTIFLDRSLRVKLFTPTAREVFNLIDGDLNRPLADITTKLNFEDLQTDVESVLETLQTVEREFETDKGRWYLMRVFPYRTKEDKISGAVITFVDITSRKKSEEMLSQSEKRFSAIINQAAAGIAETDLTGKLLLVNDSYQGMLGYSRSELLDLRIEDITHPDDYPRNRALLKKLYADGEPFMIEKRYVCKNGETIWVCSNVAVITDAENRPLSTLIVSIDITQRKKTEEELSASSVQLIRQSHVFDTALSSIADFAYTLNREGRFTYANKPLLELLGLTIEEITGKNFYELPYPPELAEKLQAQIRQVIETRKPVIDETPFANPAGENGYYEYIFTPVIGEDGTVEVIAGSTRVITERRAAEKSIRFQAQLLNTVEQSVIATDLDGKVIFWNQFAEKLYGWKAEEANGRSIMELTTPQMLTGQATEIMEQLRKGKSWSGEFTVQRRDGKTFPAQVFNSPIEDPKGTLTGIVGVSVDISDRKKAAERLGESEERMRLLVESATDFAILAITPDNIIESWNPGAEKVFGWKETDIIGKSGAVLFTPEDRAAGVPEKEKTTAAKKGRAEDERWHIRSDGSRFYASGVMMTLKGEKGFVKIARDMTDKIQAEKILSEKEMLQKLVTAQEDERKRIARDLHDELGQKLTGLRLKLDNVRKICEEEEICGKIDEIQVIAKHIDADVDFLAWELRPAALDDLGLIIALENYVREWSRHAGVTAEFHQTGLKRKRLAPIVETNLYRITQEALNNTHKHAAAKRVSVMFEKRGAVVVLIIEDDGAGFEPETKETRAKGLGLIGMHERAALCGGSLEIESAPGGGTTIYARVPLT